jgi:hypothetical protein
MRPERRIRPGLDGGLTVASFATQPHLLWTSNILSKRWGPPYGSASRLLLEKEFTWDTTWKELGF